MQNQKSSPWRAWRNSEWPQQKQELLRIVYTSYILMNNREKFGNCISSLAASSNWEEGGWY
ncbi:MAG: hypothetical protein Fur0025_08000 [Oscillatoriaceae cyanobacterium]